MKDLYEIKKEIEAIGLSVNILDPGLAVYPRKNEHIIYTNTLRPLIALVQKYNLLMYINFEDGYIRIH